MQEPTRPAAAEAPAASLRERLDDFYADYVTVIAGQDLARWPDFFTDDCLYRVTSRDNVEQGLPLDLIHCDGKGMVQDRAHAVMNTQMFNPRRFRHYLSGLRILERGEGWVRTRADFLVVQAVLNGTPAVAVFGECSDVISLEEGQPRFRERRCVHENDVITTALIFPL